jgi:hypothetical protein
VDKEVEFIFEIALGVGKIWSRERVEYGTIFCVKDINVLKKKKKTKQRSAVLL